MRPTLRVIHGHANTAGRVQQAVEHMKAIRNLIGQGFPGAIEMCATINARLAEDEVRLRSLLAVSGSNGPEAA